MNQNIADTIKMESADEWHNTFSNGVTFDMSFDDGQMFSETLETETDEIEINYVYMDIQSPIETLKVLLQQKTKRDLSNYDVWLQNVQILEPFKTLVDQCVKGEGLVQVNAQILDSVKRINIADVVKPTEEVVNAMKNGQDNIDSDIIMSENEQGTNSNDSSDAATVSSGNAVMAALDDDDDEAGQEFVNWVVDRKFLVVKKQHNIPEDPNNWQKEHFQTWLKWAKNQFKLNQLQEVDWNLNGKELYDMSLEEFRKKIPRDPGNKFWTHLELLRKCHFIAIPGDPKTTMDGDDDIITHENHREKNAIVKKTARAIGKPVKLAKLDASIETLSPSSQGNRTGNNGQIQLWQFLLEILTDREHKDIIQWNGSEGEFKLVEPDKVAELWGKRKNKHTMNYEKLSRALRYYYDGDMISKVSGKRFVYKFICDLKQLTGYNAQQLSDRVNGIPRQPRPRRYPQNA